MSAISVNRYIARLVIPDMLRMGLTSASGLRILQGEGIGVRKTDWLSDWREKAGIERKRDPLRAIPKKLRPTEATIQRTDYTQRSKYNYNYKITGYDIITEKDTETFVTVASDVMLTMEEGEILAQSLADQYKIDIEIAEMIIHGITVSKR